LEMAPDYLFPAFQLFQLDLDGGDYRGAKRALRTIHRYAETEDYLERALTLSVAEKDSVTACKHLERLCSAGGGAEGLVETAVELFDGAGWARRCESVLWKKLASGDGVAKQWVELASDRLSWKQLVRQVERLPNRDRRKPEALLL